MLGAGGASLTATNIVLGLALEPSCSTCFCFPKRTDNSRKSVVFPCSSPSSLSSRPSNRDRSVSNRSCKSSTMPESTASSYLGASSTSGLKRASTRARSCSRVDLESKSNPFSCESDFAIFSSSCRFRRKSSSYRCASRFLCASSASAAAPPAGVEAALRKKRAQARSKKSRVHPIPALHRQNSRCRPPASLVQKLHNPCEEDCELAFGSPLFFLSSGPGSPLRRGNAAAPT
mmetsp:Transcript_44015/g.141124  ORF Transcript_44015/g.141124 Transcript_44015/m.141124 type:complete len:232 (+) Transcript_44015:1064-1759(+)